MEMLYRIRLYCCIVVAKSFGSPLWIEDCHSYLLWKCVAPGLSLVDSTHHGHYCSEREIFANISFLYINWNCHNLHDNWLVRSSEYADTISPRSECSWSRVVCRRDNRGYSTIFEEFLCVWSTSGSIVGMCVYCV